MIAKEEEGRDDKKKKQKKEMERGQGVPHCGRRLKGGNVL